MLAAVLPKSQGRGHRGIVERLVGREGAVVGEARVLRPDAGVDHTDNHALAGEAAAPRLALVGETEEVAEVVYFWLMPSWPWPS